MGGGGGGEWVVVWVRVGGWGRVGRGGGWMWGWDWVAGEGGYGCVSVWVCGCVRSRHRCPAVIASAVGAQSVRCANGRRPSSGGVRVVHEYVSYTLPACWRLERYIHGYIASFRLLRLG